MPRSWIGKNQYCQNEHTTQCYLQTECNPYQMTSDIFHRTRTKNCLNLMEKQETLNKESNVEKEKKWS